MFHFSDYHLADSDTNWLWGGSDFKDESQAGLFYAYCFGYDNTFGGEYGSRTEQCQRTKVIGAEKF